MSYLTYSLNLEQLNSNKYYNDVEQISNHETLLSNLESKENSFTGMIGIACVLNLVSGGWKALISMYYTRLLVCSNHWLDKAVMTEINIDRIEKLFN